MTKSKTYSANGKCEVAAKRKPRLAVWKFASCDGCQLSLLDCEEELLAVAGKVEIAYFLEASRATVRGPYDVSLVEGSITTPASNTCCSSVTVGISCSSDEHAPSNKEMALAINNFFILDSPIY